MIVVFDAQRLLCGRLIDFLLLRNDKGVFQFASILDWC